MLVRREIWAVDRNVALTLTGTLEGYLQQFSYAGPKFGLILLGVFATVGLVLVAGVLIVVIVRIAGLSGIHRTASASWPIRFHYSATRLGFAWH